MGLNLKPLITSNPIRIPDLDGKVVAIDAFNVIYQFLATIRGPTGELLSKQPRRTHQSSQWTFL